MFWILTPDARRGYGVTYSTSRDEVLLREVSRASQVFAALQSADLRVETGKRHELLLDGLPVRQRIDEQAAIGIGGDDEMPAAARGERVAEPCRHREPPLAVEIQLRNAAKHGTPQTRGTTRPL